MSAAVCARCGMPATARVRWFVMGRSMPMFDVCGEHMRTELDVASLLNHGRPTPQHRVRVTELPEQLLIGRSATAPVSSGGPSDGDVLAALRLYRSCRERDLRPWEALEWVRAQVLERNAQPDVPVLPLLGLRLQRLLTWIDAKAAIVERWRGESARQAAEVDRYLRAPDLLTELDRLTGMTVKLDPAMPDGVVEFRHDDGRLAGRITNV